MQFTVSAICVMGVAQGATAFADILDPVEDGVELIDDLSGTCHGKPNTVEGGPNGDTISTGSTNDVIHGYGGPDTLTSDGGNDDICGGSGDDTVKGGDGIDHVTGGKGTDLVRGGQGSDVVKGGAGEDTIYDGGGIDSVDTVDGSRDVINACDQDPPAEQRGWETDLNDVILLTSDCG